MTRKVGLLTLPLHANYGGILQIAALYQFLEASGFEPVLLQKRPKRSALFRLGAAILRMTPGQNIKNVREAGKTWSQHHRFIARFMPERTGPLQVEAQFRKAMARNGIDAVIVGSDQVWRFEYHFDQENMLYFLNFADGDQVRRISYAASFGRDHWAYPDRAAEVAALLQEFDAVSVRETSGQRICRDALGRDDACVVLDPTLLVAPGFYDEAVADTPVYEGPRIVSYVLDQSAAVQNVRAVVAKALGTDRDTFELSIKASGQRLDVAQWLRAFHDAEFVMTDSFHGTVMAIVFQKPFVSIPNVDRGLDRFTTLLTDLGLQDRLLTEASDAAIGALVGTPIDYARVNARIAARRAESAQFLLDALAD